MLCSASVFDFRAEKSNIFQFPDLALFESQRLCMKSTHTEACLTYCATHEGIFKQLINLIASLLSVEGHWEPITWAERR